MMDRLRIEGKWALIFVACTLLWMVLERATGLHGEHVARHAVFTNLFALPAIVIYVLALRDKRLNHYGGTMTYAQGLTAGLILTAMIAALAPLTQYLIATVVSPAYFGNVTDFAVAEGRMTLEEAEAWFSLANYMWIATIGVVVMGAATSAVVAVFQRGKGRDGGAAAGAVLLAAAVWLAPPPVASAQVAGDDRVREALGVMETWLEAQMAYDRLPSLSAALVHDQEVVWSGAMGTAHPDTGAPATEETLYSICSISKLFTAIAVMQLRDRGLLALGDPVAEHLSWYAVEQRHERSAPVTIEGILTHSAGLPRESDHPYWTGPDFPFPSRDEIVAGLPNQETLYPAWRTFQYSNLGLTLAGEIVAERSGVSYGRYVRENILGPLGLADTHPDIPEVHRGGRLATGYGSLNREGRRNEVAFFRARGIAPAAGYASTPGDLARFASWQFRLLDDGRREEVLRGHTLQEMHRVHYVDPQWNTFWGLGFSVSRRGERTFVGHGGSCPGFRSQLLLEPDDRIAVVFMTNAMANAGMYARGIYDLTAEAVRGAAGDGTDDAGAEEEGGGDEASAPEAGPDLTDYLGTYDSQPWGGETAVVRWKGGLALLRLPTDNPLQALTRLEHGEGDVFYRIRSDGDRGEAAVFERGPDDRVTGLRIHGQLSRRLR